MAVNRVLTSDEREILQQSTRFKSQVSWALKNFSSYWADATDANAKVGAVGYERWAKNFIWASERLADLSLIDDNQQIPKDFTVLLKGMQLWDSAVNPFNVDTVIDYMIANNRFDELAGNYVNFKTPTPVF